MLFLFFMLNNFFIVLMVKEKVKVKLAPAIPTGAPITVTEK